MMARDSWNFFTKLSEVNRGMNLIDKAIGKEPNNCVIRLVRAHNSLSLPDFLNRKPIAKQDFLLVQKLFTKDPTILDAETKADVVRQLDDLK
jgi:hypothetical protein